MTLSGLTDLLIVASAISVIAAVGWYFVRMRARLGGLAGATAMFAAFVSALAVSRVAAFFVERGHGAVAAFALEAIAAAVTVAVAVAVWPLMPKLLAMPTRHELVEANQRLAAEQEARQALVEEMHRLNADLERRVAERTGEFNLERRRFEVALADTDITVAAQDRDLRYTWMYNAPASLGGVDPIGQLPEELLPASTAAAQGAVKRRVLATGWPERFEVALPAATGTVWFEGRVEPLIDADEIVGVMTVAVDITRHKTHEREMRDVLRELTHRSKNLLAVVQGIARQSAAGAPEASSFLPAFTGRLQALSRVHEILVEEGWRGVGLRDLVRREWAASGAAAAAAVAATIDLPDRLLSPEAAQNFALAFHELLCDPAPAHPASAAARIGPFAAGPPEFGPPVVAPTTIVWSEAGGRFGLTCARPGGAGDTLRRGFGRILLERHLPHAVSGSAALEIGDDGVRYRLEGALAALGPA